jgi:penicillin-binding protein 2
LGIGQGYNNFTMLQLTQAMSALANQGVKHKPRLAVATEDPVLRTRSPIPSEPPENLHYKADNVATILRAMEAVTTAGTSTRVFAGAPYRSGGKTGTAQAVTIGQKDKYDVRRLEEHQRDHSLYLAFAPVESPQVALAVVVENAGFGAAHAAPIARRVFDYLLLGHYPSEEDMAAVSKGLAAAPIGKPRMASEISLGPQP